VIFVGAGPGDPGLGTVRGARVLGEADVVVYDGALARAWLDGLAPGAERLRVLVPHEGETPGSGEALEDGGGGVPATDVPGLLVTRARAGQRVVRLVQGDATDVRHEAAAVAGAGLALEVVPGVGPGVAGAVAAGIPLGSDTRVIEVEGTDLAGTVARLRADGVPAHTPAVAIGAAGTAAQRTVTAVLGDLVAEAARQGLGRAELVVAGPGVTARLPWRERRPLHGRRVLVTRPRAQAGGFTTLLEDYGAEVVALPTIRIEPPDDWRPLDEAIGRLPEFAWIVFTSANGVSAFQERLGRGGRDARALAGLGVAAIGTETADALRRAGIEPDVVPTEFRAEGLVEALGPRVQAGQAVLLVRAAEAREVLPRELAARGALVSVVPAYRTVAAKEEADHVLALLEARRIDVVTFTSSSTVRGLVGLLPPDEARRLLAGVVLAAIGPITAATVAEHGLPITVMPRQYTASALVAAIARHFAGSQPGPR
jgi:uroporphyrinogen III methyltransferase/synthase